MSTISQLLASIDDVSWEAVGSKGLLRRATKELEKGTACELLSETPFVLTAKAAEWTVTIPAEGPAKAKCNCGAPGCCHHIILTGLYIRKQAAHSAASESAPTADAKAAQEASDSEAILRSLCGLDFAIVKRWCGAPAWRSALRILASGVTVDVQNERGSVFINMKPINIGCRFLAGVGLDGAIVVGGDSGATKSFVGAAVVALKARNGEPLPPGEAIDTALGEEKGAPRTREEVLAVARSLLEMTVGAGLSHSGASSAERFSTLAVSADGTNLPRLARALKTVAEELGMIAKRHGRADAERTLEVMAQAYALVAALEKGGDRPAGHLIGQHRTGYADVATIQLAGITGFPWQARSGYRGITLLFWEAQKQRWASWTEARSASSDPQYDPMKAFDADGPWASGVSIRDLVARQVRLANAKQNALGRLSTTKACKAETTEGKAVRDLDFGRYLFDSWEKLAAHIASTNATGLKHADPMEDWVMVIPTKWGDRRFDRVEQRLSWTVTDDQGRALALALMYSDMTRHGVETLEKWEPPLFGRVRILCRVLRDVGEFAVEPFTLFAPSSDPIHLLIPPAKANTTRAPSSKLSIATQDDDDELEGEVEDESAHRSTNRWLSRTHEHLVALAEAGATDVGPHRDPQVQLLGQKLMDAGLPILSSALNRTDQRNQDFPGAVLRGAYLVRLHRQCLTTGFVPGN